MKTSVEKLEGTNVKLTVTVSAEDVDKAIDEVYANLAKKVKVPGFRAGKAPRPVIDTHVGSDYVLREATEAVVNGFYAKALDAEGLRPVDSPEIGEIEPVVPGEEFTFTAEVLTRPELTLSGYKDIVVELPSAHATDREIDAQIEYMAERFATLEPAVDRGVQADDFVLASFVGTVDGEEYEGNRVDKYLYEMNRGLMPAEFDEGLIGVKAGEETRIEFPIPDTTSNPDYVGRTAQFDVTVHEIKAKVLPTLDDDFASEVGGFETIEELRADIRQKQEAQKSVAQMQLKERETRAALAGRLEGEVPESMAEGRKGAMMRDFETGLESRGTNLEGYVQATGITPEQIQADIELQAMQSVREELALEALFRDLGMDVTDDDIDEELQSITTSQEGSESAEELRKRWEDAGVMGAVREQIMHRKAMLWLLDNVEVIEKAESPEPDSAGSDAALDAKPAKKPAAKRASKKKAEVATEADAEADANEDAIDTPKE